MNDKSNKIQKATRWKWDSAMESQKYLCRLCQRQTESMPFPLVKHLLNTNSEVNVTHISDGLESEYEWNSPEIDKLRD